MALDGVILVVPTGAQILKGLVLFEYDRGNFRAVVVESGAASDSSATAAAPSWNPAIMANGQWRKSDKMAAVARPGRMAQSRRLFRRSWLPIETEIYS